MAWNPLVVDRGLLTPGAELGHALGDGPPHSAGPGEVAGGRGVVDAAGGRGSDHALERSDGLRNVELRARERFDRGVGGLLHPTLEGIGSVKLTGRVGVELGHRFLGGGASAVQGGRRRLLFGNDAAELLQTPLVGLIEIDGRAKEGLGEQAVAVAANGVLFRSARSEFIAKEGGEFAVGGFRFLGAIGQRGGIPNSGAALGQTAPERASLGKFHGLGDAGLNLATRRHKSGVRAFAERLDVAGDRAGNVGHAACHGIPVLRRIGGHQVEDVADSLQWGGDHVQIGELLAGVVQLTFEGEALAHGGLRDDVDVILGLDAAELAEHGGALSILGGEASGGEVVELALVTLKPEHGAEAGGKPPERLDVGIGDGVGCGRSSGFVSHPLSLRRRADIAPDCPADVTRSAE